ncbi:disulfide oxidoreductase [Paenibacillus polymyxa]|uniref:disulfide oxidoreductase n=1 Tax=Paenibacillus polymyxa TaxID=1406 RepID=UPI00201937C1|nr:disulfide oxidoreductase [Paenibacillus polymyxa]MEE4581442.1 disulfide oxidoreductase [Paenibacillus polymyxa]UQQ35798.1 disulfide bond formation protein B [Paenibacillus polymyxa]
MIGSFKKTDIALFAAWVVACVATLGSLYLSEILGYEPCKLCWFQRILMYPLTLLLGIAYFRGDTKIRIYVMPLAIIGGAISAYHFVIQRIHASAKAATQTSTACGRVSCEQDYLNWLDFITIPLLALIAFILIIVAMGYIIRQEKKSATGEVQATELA